MECYNQTFCGNVNSGGKTLAVGFNDNVSHIGLESDQGYPEPAERSVQTSMEIGHVPFTHGTAMLVAFLESSEMDAEADHITYSDAGVVQACGGQGYKGVEALVLGGMSHGKIC